MAGVQKVTLNGLNLNIKNALIIGIVIAKNSPRIFGLQKKNGHLRGVTSFTIRDSDVDTINVDVWGSEHFVTTFYERFLVGDVVDITSPKICIKTGDNEAFRPQVTSPFYLSVNEGLSDVNIHGGNSFSSYLPLLHIPTKHSSGYHGLAEVGKLPEETNSHVDLLVVVKSVNPVKIIRTKTGSDMSVRAVDITDNTTPATFTLDVFDKDTIQRAEEWRAFESVLFIADARVCWRGKAVKLQTCAKSVVTHQPHSADAEALRLYIRNQTTTRGGEAAAWAAWSGECTATASVTQIRDRLTSGTPFCATLHALLSHFDLDELLNSTDNNNELQLRFADSTGELSARLPFNVLEEILGHSVEQIKMMSPVDRATIRWGLLLEQCSAKLAASPPRLIVLALRRASAADTVPLY